MREYLQVTAGRYKVLVDARQVQAVVALPADVWARGHTLWRGRILPLIDLARILGEKPASDCPRESCALVMDDFTGHSGILAPSHVGPLVCLDEETLHPLPGGLPDSVADWFDGVAVNEEGVPGALCLKVGVALSRAEDGGESQP
ncbi:chemotaxis protein CheW [Pararhodospirillum oryzae]|uniref:CheW-like domain-containing protein n=1 Tax=Pararhodospirillum oryzae TaxID=478448 RepID=A0A512H396_9PROT|nr:chemotaxis protein CheW [Pararhodospirillum oryzae]GEO79903.1 hypothetical protein ROR02_00340 [Pararhodospirillum oryzae]